MMFDPANLGANLQPGDKMSLTFSKGQPKTQGPSFMGNVEAAQGGPQGGPQAPPPGAPPMGAPMPPPPAGPAPGSDDSLQRAMMIQAMQARMGGGA